MSLSATEIPDLYPAFINGEMSVGPVGQLTAPGLSSYFFARFFDDLPPGRYKIRTTMNDAGSLWVGSGANSMRLITTFVIDADLTAWEHEFDLYEGDRRIDIYVNNLTIGASPCGFIFGLYRNGQLVYASRAEHWRYDMAAPLPDSELRGARDTRRDLPVFAVLPNWKDGITERIEYLTDILEGERATEQRRSLRTIPRRSIEAGFMRTGALQDRLNNFFTGIGTKPFLVPLWHEQYRIQFPLNAASPTVAFPDGSLVMREFRPDDVAIVFDRDPSSYDVVVIQGVNMVDDTISIGAGLTRTWPEGTRIIPLRKARIIDTPSMENRTDTVATAQIRFELIDSGLPFEPSWGHCCPLLKLEPNWRENVVGGYDRLTFTLDNRLANAFIVDPSDQTLVGLRGNYLLRHREQVFYLRRFIAAARGRAVRFYLPSYTNDVVPTGNIAAGQTYFDIVPSGLWETTQTRQYSRRVIAFYPHDGDPIYRTVTRVEPINLSGPPYAMTAERLVVDAALPAINMANIRRISWVQVVRFDQDAFELFHPVDDSAVVRAALVFKGVDPQGMPSINC